MIRLLGGILLAAGILIAGASGLCSAMFLFQMGGATANEALGLLLLVAVVGGLPFLLGLGLIYLGRQLRRPEQASELPGD